MCAVRETCDSICGMSRAAAGKANDSEQNVPDDVPPLVPTREPLEEESKLSASAREGEAELARSPGGSNRHIMTTRCEPSQPDPFPTWPWLSHPYPKGVPCEL